ncbi:hypothetical protein RJ640_013165 [Escallonia rubra]|uniref:Uncharacterized protein n=1 Tax=Escallonia rubra TaxID=112253 RepID=A0AA88S1P3_9ASTE|nr:hypothetical protein RJ640_013165 [Escallonia rubra]
MVTASCFLFSMVVMILIEFIRPSETNSTTDQSALLSFRAHIINLDPWDILVTNWSSATPATAVTIVVSGRRREHSWHVLLLRLLFQSHSRRPKLDDSHDLDSKPLETQMDPNIKPTVDGGEFAFFSKAATYSASTEDCATVCCFFDAQQNMPEPSENA